MGLRSRVAFFGVIALVSGLAGCGDNIEPEPDPDTAVVIALETNAPMQVAAGDTMSVSCTLLENDITTMVPAEVRVVSESSVIRMNGMLIARRVGTVEVTCALPGRGLVDPTPAIVEIVAGPAANVVTTIAPDPVIAGNTATATCTVYDAYGNLLDGETPTLQISPIDAGNTITDLQAYMTRAGHYTARCNLPGTITNNAGFDVVPNLPANLVIQRWPDLPVYAVGNYVEVNHIITDRFGNEIYPGDVTKTVATITGTGPVVTLGPEQWRFDGEGRYRVTVTVNGATDNNVVLSQSVDVVVNSRGPAIVCNGDATMVTRTPGTSMTITGSVDDVNGVASLTVNGNPVTVGTNGSFSYAFTTRFGMNFAKVSATDSFGETTSKVCTYLVSNRYADPAVAISDTVSLKLLQSAVDDGSRTAPINSLADILYAVLNSQGLRTTVHNTLLNANPLKPHSCDSQTCVFGACVCWYSSGIWYHDSSFPGPNTVSLSVVDGGTSGGVRAQVRIPNIGVRLQVWGRVSGIPYDTTGWVRASYVDVGVTLDTTVSNGRPRITVRPNSVTADVGTITTEFNGVDGWIINNIVVPIAQGYIRDTLRNTLRDFVTNNFNAVLDSVIGGLNIASLGTTFNVPRIDGSGNLALSFGLSFSYVNAATNVNQQARLLFGIGTRFSAAIANAFPTSGVALPPGNNLVDVAIPSPHTTHVGAHIGVFNGALHALWRANFFAATVDASTLGAGVPAGTSLAITTRLPPVSFISTGNVVQLHLGALDLVVQHPSLPANLAVRLGAEAHASVSLVGNDLIFGGLTIDALHVSTDSINLTPSQQTALEDTLRVLVQQLLDSSLNDALPALPIPSFPIPSSLAQYGLPSGSRLGLVSPSLSIQQHHFVLRGGFGIF